MWCKYVLVMCLHISYIGFTHGSQDVATNKVQNTLVDEMDSTKNSIEDSTFTIKNATVKVERPTKVCPKNGRIPFLSLPCETSKDCAILGPDLLCCRSRCIRGVDPPKPDIKHDPLFFGLVERICPVDPLAEILDIKECDSDADCTPRICCAEKNLKGPTGKNYCRIAAPNLDRIPFAKQLFQPVQTFVSFMQCSPPPPPVLDLFPKECSSPIDCFPNLCCQEGGKKYCRPPKRSLLTLMAGVARRFGSSELAKTLIERITN